MIPITPPEYPINFAFAVIGNNGTLTWDGNAASYEVSYWKSSDPNTILGTFNPLIRSQAVAGLVPGVNYEFKVTNIRGTYRYSASFFYTHASTCPEFANFKLSDVTDSSAILEWDAVAGDPVYMPAWFEVDRQGHTIASEYAETNELTFQFTNLKPCTRYIFKVFYECSPEFLRESPEIRFSTRKACDNDPNFIVSEDEPVGARDGIDFWFDI